MRRLPSRSQARPLRAAAPVGHGSWRLASFGLLAAGLGSACNISAVDPRPEIAHDNALTICTIPKDLKDRAIDRPIWPVLPPPSGMYLNRFDPHSVFLLGFAAKTPTCLTLVAPTESELDDAHKGVARLDRVLDDIAAQSAELGGCLCAQAFQRGLRDLLAACRHRNPMENCGDMNDASNARLQSSMERLQTAAEQSFVPPRHWRLAGTTDRPGTFQRDSARLIGGFSVGSEVFIPGDERGNLGANGKLLEAMLEQPYVVAVVRQDRGRSLLVVRQRFDGQYLFDLFEHDLSRAAAHELRILWDNSQVGWYIEALRPPQQSWKSRAASIADETLVFDRDGLSRVHRAQRLGAPPSELADSEIGVEATQRLEIWRTEDGRSPTYEAQVEISSKLAAAMMQQSSSDPFTSVEAFYRSAHPSKKAALIDRNAVSPVLSDFFPPDDFALLDIYMHALRSKPLKLAGTPTSWTMTLDEGLLLSTAKKKPQSPWLALLKRLGEPQSQLKGELLPDSSSLKLELTF